MSWELSSEELMSATQARLTSSEPASSLKFSGVGTDTRKDLTGCLFIALQGDRFDAHEFLNQAEAAGAQAALVHRVPQQAPKNLPLFVVSDTLLALQNLSTYWRRKHRFRVLAVTGSNGKTTTKEFAKALISPFVSAYASQGSFNNHWGVPLSLLSAGPEHKVVIQEMGMNHKGEIRRLCEIAEPDVVVCTMVGTSHIGELGSQQAVAEAKEEIYQASPKAEFIFNLDNEFTRAMYEKYKARAPKLTTFSSFSEEADVTLRADRMDLNGLHVTGKIAGVAGDAQVAAFGRQNVVNLMAAGCLALSAGVKAESIWQTLPQCKTGWGRNEWKTHPCGARVLFDAYNANPESMAALLKNLFEMDAPSGKRVLVLGEMKELGAEASKAHQKLGELAGSVFPDTIWFVGQYQREFEAGLKTAGFDKNLFLSNTYEQNLALKIGSVLNQEDIVVIKGSRAMQLEQILEAWRI